MEAKHLVSHPKKEYHTLKQTQCLTYFADILQYSKKLHGVSYIYAVKKEYVT
jgi:hypothetical protein